MTNEKEIPMKKHSEDGHSSEHRHHHKKHKEKSKVKPVLYGFLSFMLSLCLFLLSIVVILDITVFSKEFMKNIMNSNDYYSIVKDELRDELKILGNASGMTPELVDSFVDTLDIQNAVDEYIDSFYSDKDTLVDTISFKQNLYASLENYIEEKNLDRDKINGESLNYLVEEASRKYVNIISIPFFSVIGNYIPKIQSIMNYITAGLIIMILILTGIIIFTNSFKHRRYRYLTYGLGGGALNVLLIPMIVFFSGKIEQINFANRSLYSLFVNYANSFFAGFWFFAAAYFILTLVSFLLFYKYYQKAIKK